MLGSNAVKKGFFSVCQEFSDWVTSYNRDSTNVHYFVFYDERPVSGDGLPFIRLYDCGSGVDLPMKFSIPEDPGEVTYRNVNTSDECWKSISNSSNEITIDSLQPDESYFFRVARLTQGGKSPFGPISSEITIDPVYQRPTDLQCISVTDTTIAISWNQVIPEEDEVCDACRVAKEEENAKSFQLSGFMIHCWETGNRESTLIQRSTSDKSIELHHLNVGSLYSIQ
ncbi:hypothetical protein DAPPUDRAFT_277063, partial [Daphnia pulex]